MPEQETAETPARGEAIRAARANSFSWQALTVAMSRAFQKSTYFITSLILARLLGPEGRGLVSALLVPAQLAVNFSEMGIRQSTAYHIGRNIFPIERLLPTVLTLVPLASLFAGLAAVAYLDYAGIARDDWGLRLLAIASIPTSLFSSYASGVFLGQQRIAAFRSTSWRPALLRLILIVLLGWGLGYGIYGVMVANLGASLLGAGYALFLLGRSERLRFGFDREVAMRLQRRGISYAGSLFVLILNYKIMILLLARYSTLSEVGIYTQATVIAELIWEIPSAVSALLLSRGVNARESRAFSQKVLVLARLSFLAAIAAAIGIALVADFMFPLLFGHRFAASADICVLLLPGVVAFILFKILNTDMAGRGKPWASMLVMLPVLFLNVLAGLWMIERDGARGAAIASSLAYVVATVLYIGLYHRMTRIPLGDMLRFRRSDFALLGDQLAVLVGRRRKPAPRGE
jgi:O-antigen/teichoic acid export membrane protein